MAGYDVANAPDNVFLAELENMQGDGTRLDLMFQEPEAATNQPKVVDHFHRQRSQQWRQLLRQGRLESLRQLQNHSAKLTTDTVLINYTAWDVTKGAPPKNYILRKRCPASGKMGPDQRRKVEMLHNCTYGYAIGVFINGRPMKKRDADYTLLQRQFMTAHKPAVPQSFLSTMTANVVSTCRNTATALSADFTGQETIQVDEAAKPTYTFQRTKL
jgi:hypothetical protein